MIPLSIPNFEGNEQKYVIDAVSRGWVSTSGDYIEKFEKSLSSFVKTDDAVACQSGTSAIHLSLIEAGVGKGDLVIAPTLTFIAAVNPIKYCNADPVFIDCDDSLCIDPDKIKSFCENECYFENNRLIHKMSKMIVRAIIVVHVFGNMADMERIMEIADEYKLKVIEDATEALGSKFSEGKYKGMYAGTIGDFGAYSFNGNKIITTGGGGMVVAKNFEMLSHIRFLSTQAKSNPSLYYHDEIGYNYRMTNVQAAIGLAQIELLSVFLKRKNINYDKYYNGLLEIKDKAELLPFRKGVDSNKWFYSLLLKDDKFSSIEFVDMLEKKGIQTRCIWGLIHKQKPYYNSVSYQIDTADYYVNHIVNIPCSTNLSEDDIDTVCLSIKELLN